jgi:hypothetical protein
MRLLALPVYVGTAILMVNQRVGWEDGNGLQLLPIILRSDLWIALGLALVLVVTPRWNAVPAAYKKVSTEILAYTPALFLFFTLLASALNGIVNGHAIDAFGMGDLIKVVLCTGLGILVFKLTLSYEGFGHRMVNILMWAPVANVFVGIFAATTLINNIAGFNTASDGGFSGAGFIGLGGRFQGLGSNANIAMTQTCLGLALLVPRIMYSPATMSLWEKTGLLIYGIAMCAIMAWTGVRAALVIWPLMFLMLLWLRFRFTTQGLIKNVSLFFKIALFAALVWIASTVMNMQQTLLERLGTDDGRVFLWEHYFSLLLQNPMGFGLGFEAVAGTDSLVEGQRLPPHNALLQAGMYAGLGGVFVSFFLIFRMGAFFSRIKRLVNLNRSSTSLDLMGLMLAWSSLLISVMFAGLLQADFSFSILTALLLGMAARSGIADKPILQHRHPLHKRKTAGSAVPI